MLALWLALAAHAADPAPVLAGYERARAALVDDRLEDARAAGDALVGAADASPAVVAAARGLATASDAEYARTAFGEVSRAVVLELAATGAPDGTKVFHCPMTAGFGYWLQPTAGIANPYMGVAMPTCGEGTSLRAAARAAASTP